MAANNNNNRKDRQITDPVEYTPFFSYRGAKAKAAAEELFCESVSSSTLAQAAGTPAYVYSAGAIKAAYSRLDKSFGSLPHAICYAVKANSNLSILRLLAGRGSNFDIVSAGELDRLRRIGVEGQRVVFSGVGKTREEMREALNYSPDGKRASARRGIFVFNVESEAELETLIDEAARHVKSGGARPYASIRINPDVEAGGHKHISTGKHHHKFGVDWETARRLYLAHKDSPWLAWRGISAHLGSQILTSAPYRAGLARLASHFRELAANGIQLETVDIGGGLGIRYTDEEPLDLAEYARTLSRITRGLKCKLLVEPGRWLVGPVGILLTKVIYVKNNRGKNFVIVDAAMNDLIRPVLYEAHHPITPAIRSRQRTQNGSSSKAELVDVVGPVCESGDFLAQNYRLPEVKTGDLLVIWAAGAYGFAQASNYNARRRSAEVLVDGHRFRVVRRRETYDDLVRQEMSAMK
jgi:diaminopimelate decarboxylase